MATHGLQLWLANGIVAAVGLVTPLAFVRLATPEEYGRFSFIAAVLALANTASLPGLNISLTQAAARGFHGALALTLRTRLKWAPLGALGLVGYGAWLALTGDGSTGRALLVLAAVFPLVYGADVAQAFMNGVQRFAALSTWMLIAAAAPSIAVIVLLLTEADGAVATIGYFLALAAVNVLAYWWAGRYRTNGLSDPEAIAYGKRLTLITALGAAQYYIDRLIVGAALGLNAVAMYSAGKLFQQILKVTWGAVHQLMLPKLASRPPEAARRLNRVTLPYIWAGFGILAFVLVLGIPAIVEHVLGEAYAASVPIARLLTIGMLAAIPGAQFEVLFRSVGDERRLYRQRLSFAAVESTLLAGGTWAFGLMGAVWATVIAQAWNSIYGFLLDRRR